MDPQAVGWGATELPLTKHSGRAAVKSRLEQLGHVLTEEEVNTVFERFKKVGDSKKFVYDDDLSAIVDDSLHASTGLWELDFLQFVAGSHARPTATVGLLKEGKKFEDSSTGNGAVDAVIKAIERITRRKGTLKGLQRQRRFRREGRSGRSHSACGLRPAQANCGQGSLHRRH